LDKYTAPTLEVIDFPNLDVDQTCNDKDSGVSDVGTYTGELYRQDPNCGRECAGSRIRNDQRLHALPLLC
jgi:hypothetical protein